MSMLEVSWGHYSCSGVKSSNQDYSASLAPSGMLRTAKGVACALADGISSSQVSGTASRVAVESFLEDYFCTPEAWSVRQSAYKVLCAINSWLFSQTQSSPYRYEQDQGYVCTFSGLVLKSHTAHVLHVGDARIYRLRHGELEQLTSDHRVSVGQGKSYLSRALGVSPKLDLDYLAVELELGDCFVIMTDGVHEFISEATLVQTVLGSSENTALLAELLACKALDAGSRDNVTVQVVRVDQLPSRQVNEIFRDFTRLPVPKLFNARDEIDGYQIIRELHASSRSHVYLAKELESENTVVLKAPSVDLSEDTSYLERFLLEEWVARRIDSPYVLKPAEMTRPRSALYVVFEWIKGQTLTQWMRDNPTPSMTQVRQIVEQIAKGLLAFHRKEMLHQDLRPENILIDSSETVHIIDFGSVRVAGLSEMGLAGELEPILGTVQYTAPEYFLGHSGTPASDLFSLGVIAYQMLTGALPYGAEIAKTRSLNDQRKLAYKSAWRPSSTMPVWVDEVLRKAVQIEPHKRYAELSEFVYDLQHRPGYLIDAHRRPLTERNPVKFWKTLTLGLAVMVVVLLAHIHLN